MVPTDDQQTQQVKDPTKHTFSFDEIWLEPGYKITINWLKMGSAITHERVRLETFELDDEGKLVLQDRDTPETDQSKNLGEKPEVKE